jgi:hypothetical protein
MYEKAMVRVGLEQSSVVKISLLKPHPLRPADRSAAALDSLDGRRLTRLIFSLHEMLRDVQQLSTLAGLHVLSLNTCRIRVR